MILPTRYVIGVHNHERSARYYRDVLRLEVGEIGYPSRNDSAKSSVKGDEKGAPPKTMGNLEA